MKTKTKPTLKELSKLTGISVSSLSRYRRAGIDVTDAKAVQAYVAEQKHAPRASEPPDLRAARLRKLTLEADRIEHALNVQRGLYVAVAEVERDMSRIGAATLAAMQKMRGDVPNLAGRDESECAAWIDEKIERICSDLKSEMAALYA